MIGIIIKLKSGEWYSKIRDSYMFVNLQYLLIQKLKKNQLYYPPIATTPSQQHLNTFLCNMADTIINDKQVPGKKSEIGFTVDNASPLFKYLFPVNGVLSYKWSVSTLNINKLREKTKLMKLHLILLKETSWAPSIATRVQELLP
jgi:hypothetical protein